MPPKQWSFGWSEQFGHTPRLLLFFVCLMVLWPQTHPLVYRERERTIWS